MFSTSHLDSCRWPIFIPHSRKTGIILLLSPPGSLPHHNSNSVLDCICFIDSGNTQLQTLRHILVWERNSTIATHKSYAYKARGSFCLIAKQENQFNKYLLSTYSARGSVCILRRKMVWPWGGGKNKNMVRPICNLLRSYREQGKLHKILVQSD